jgi:hypothetical protein
MNFPPLPIMKSLAALTASNEFVLLEDGHFACGKGDWCVRVPSEHVAELDARGWIAFEQPDATGTPTRIYVTEQGKYAVRRFCDKHKLNHRVVK